MNAEWLAGVGGLLDLQSLPHCKSLILRTICDSEGLGCRGQASMEECFLLRVHPAHVTQEAQPPPAVTVLGSRVDGVARDPESLVSSCLFLSCPPWG